MLPARVFCGNTAAVIQQEMDQHVAQGSAALSLASRNQQPFGEWLGVRLMLAWYKDHISPTQLAPIWRRYAPLLHDIHSPAGTGGAVDDGRNWPHCVFADACLSRHLGHAWAVSDVYYHRMADLFIELLQLHSLSVLIPNLAVLDRPSREVLLRLAQHEECRHGELMVGLLNRMEKPLNGRIQRHCGQERMQERDILLHWLQSLDMAQECPVLEVAEPTRRQRAAKPGLQGTQQAARRRGEWLDKTLKQLDGEGPRNAREAIYSMWRWYRCHAYRNVLELAGGLSDGDVKQLADEELALFHTLVALAAHQLGLLNGDLHQWIPLFSEQAALALNRLPVGPLRCAVLLRLAKFSEEYADDFVDAPDYQQLSLAESQRLEGLQGQYQQAWAALIHARLQHQQRRAASTDLMAVQKVMRRLQAEYTPVNTDEATRRDLALTQSALRISHSAMATYQAGGSRATGGKLPLLPAPDGDGVHALCYEANYWMEHYQKRREVTAALAWAAIFRRAGRELTEARYALEGGLRLARFHYQLGALGAAASEFAIWRGRQNKWRSRVLVGAPWGGAEVPWLTMVLTELRQGSVHVAQALLQQRRHEGPRGDAAADALHASAAGLLAARHGEKNEAKRAFQQAIAHANESYSISIFARITQLIGQAYEDMAQPREATALYRNILDNALDLDRSRSCDMFPIMVRLMGLQDYNRGYVQYIFNHFTTIMQEAENWWYLADLLELIRHNEGAANFALFNHDVLAELIWCASQRVDCEQSLRHFCQRLPVQEHELISRELRERQQTLATQIPALLEDAEVEKLLRRHALLLNGCHTSLGMEQPAA